MMDAKYEETMDRMNRAKELAEGLLIMIQKL